MFFLMLGTIGVPGIPVSSCYLSLAQNPAGSCSEKAFTYGFRGLLSIGVPCSFHTFPVNFILPYTES